MFYSEIRQIKKKKNGKSISARQIFLRTRQHIVVTCNCFNFLGYYTNTNPCFFAAIRWISDK